MPCARCHQSPATHALDRNTRAPVVSARPYFCGPCAYAYRRPNLIIDDSRKFAPAYGGRR